MTHSTTPTPGDATTPEEAASQETTAPPSQEPIPEAVPDSTTSITVSPFYHSAVNAITEPDKFVACSRYFVRRWMPLLGGTGTAIVLALRSLGFYQPKTGELRNGIEIELTELAALVGVHVATVKREFGDVKGQPGTPYNPVLRQFVHKEKQYWRDPVTNRLLRTANIYRITMDDPIHDDDLPRLNLLLADWENGYWVRMDERMDDPIHLDDWLESTEKPDETYEPSFPEARGQGYVYLLESGGVYKIGKANDLDRRITQIAPKLPYECRLVHAISSDDCLLLERWLHERFGEWRLNGEWFELTAEQVRWFQDQAQINQRDLINQKDLIN